MTFPLVRGLLPSALVTRLAALSMLLVLLISQSLFAQSSQIPYRDHIVRLLQQLVETGYPLDNEHDEGEWLQGAVIYAIQHGDREIENLAIRAAVPLRARVTQPVGSTEARPYIEVLSYQVLALSRPVPYVATIEASLDGGDFIELGTQPSGSPRTFEVARLGAAALLPGAHHVRMRAWLVFGDPQRPFHTETRQLASISYAVYDPLTDSARDARWLTHSPAAFYASDFDPLLPAAPFLPWLAGVLANRGEVADPRMWTSRYCSELTDEHHAAHEAAGICAVVYFTVGGNLGQIWFRTGQVVIDDTAAMWYPAERPSVEALLLFGGRSPRLSALPPLLDQPYEPYPRDTALSAPEIVITPAAPKPGASAKAVITLRNRGEVSVENVKLELVHLDGQVGGGMRHFVVDVPAFGSTSVSLDVTFRSGYGIVFALPFIKDHGLVHDVIGAPLESPCAVRVVNAAAAPRDYVRASVGHMSFCLDR